MATDTGGTPVTRSKAIGTATERAVVMFLRRHGFPHAERRALAGVHDLGDIVGTPGIAWEVKGGKTAATAADGLVGQWLTETERERRAARADIGVLVLKRTGIGADNAGRWWAVLQLADLTPTLPRLPARVTLADAVTLLHHAGYGQVAA